MATSKADTRRVGLFSEMKYITTSDPYVGPPKPYFSPMKGKNFTLTPHVRPDGRFSKFERGFDKDEYVDPGKLAAKAQQDADEKKRGPGYIIPPGRLRTRDGTFSGDKVGFLPADYTHKIAKPKEPRNFKTCPTAKTINKPAEYKSSPFDLALQKARDEAKKSKELCLSSRYVSVTKPSKVFDKTVFSTDDKVLKPRPQTTPAAPPKIAVPFFPPKTPIKAAYNRDSHCFDKTSYTPPKIVAPKPAKHTGPSFKPISNTSRFFPVRSISAMNATRGHMRHALRLA